MTAKAINHQRVLNDMLNDTVAKFARDYGEFDLETILAGLDDAKSDAETILAKAMEDAG